MIKNVVITVNHVGGPDESITFIGEEGVQLMAKLSKNMEDFGNAEFRRIMTKLQSQPRGKLETMFSIDDFVRKEGGDFSYEGHIVSVIQKRRSGEVRYVVENEAGMLFIFRGEQLKHAGHGDVRSSEA